MAYVQLPQKTAQVSKQSSHLQMYAALSQYELQKRKSLLPITKPLRNHNIIYHWGYPMKLIVTHNDATSLDTSLTESLALLRSWDILPEQESTS